MYLLSSIKKKTSKIPTKDIFQIVVSYFPSCKDFKTDEKFRCASIKCFLVIRSKHAKLAQFECAKFRHATFVHFVTDTVNLVNASFS